MSKKNYKWWLVWLLNYVTCGVYGIIWWYNMTKTNNQIAAKRGEAQIGGYIKCMILSFITCGIYGIIWQYKFAKQQIAIAQASGVKTTPTQNAFVLFLIACVPVYNLIAYCANFNNTVNAN